MSKDEKSLAMFRSQSHTSNHFISQNRKALERAEKLLMDHKERVVLQRPNPSTWSPAECIGHIVRYNLLYVRNIEQGLRKAEPDANLAGTAQALNLRLPFRWIARFFEPPYNLKIKTLKPLDPRDYADTTPGKVLEDYKDVQGRLNTQLEKAGLEGFDINRIKVPNPVFTFVKIRISECYAVIDAHQRRHLWQAEQYVKRLSK